MLQVTLSKPLFFFSIPPEKIRNQGIFRVFRGQRKGPVVIRQKGESQNGCHKKAITHNFPKNEHFLPLDTHTRLRIRERGVRNVNFSKHFAYFYIDNTKSFSSTSGNAILLGSFI